MQDQEYCRSKVYAQLATLCNGAHPDGHASLLKRAGDQIVEDKVDLFKAQSSGIIFTLSSRRGCKWLTFFLCLFYIACGPAEGEPLHGSNHCHALKKFVGNVRGCIGRPRVEEDANYPRPAPVEGKAKSPNRHSRLMKCLGCLLCVPLDEKEEDERTAERYPRIATLLITRVTIAGLNMACAYIPDLPIVLAVAVAVLYVGIVVKTCFLLSPAPGTNTQICFTARIKMVV